MKYGASLRAHSIPAWAHHNIDYDEIKAFIKENTTPGNGTAVSIPGTGNAQVMEVEDALFDILSQQHKRINLFVWSKTGEIRRRLDHLAKQTSELRSKGSNARVRITAKRLERYGRLESDVLKAGEELQSLSRFITAQQTAFRKLLKKYKKWSRSSGLELNFNKEIISDSTSFTNLDLEPMLAGWEQTLDAVRVLYEERMSTSSVTPQTNALPHVPEAQIALAQVRAALQSNSQAKFDTTFATLPLGKCGQNAVYWVHPENIVELQVLLLQHTRSHAVRRQSMASTPVGTLSRRNSHNTSSPSRRNSSTADQDSGLLIIDDQDRFVQEQSSTTLEAKESTVGVRLQNATVSARWTREDEAIIAARLGGAGGDVTETAIKRKYLAAALDPASTVSADRVSSSNTDTNTAKQIEDLRSWFGSNEQFKPLASIGVSRQRFIDIASDSRGFVLATLDKSISMKQSSMSDLSSIDTTLSDDSAATFPFAVLRVRQEGSPVNDLLRVLESSHLVERVRGFSLEYHAVWHCCQPVNVVPPFWMPLLSRDIRKVPRLTSKREACLNTSGFGSQSTTPNISASCTSESGNGETTAVEDHPSTGRITIADQLQTPPLSSFKKKRTRSYGRGYPSQAPKQNYWSEYDNPSDSDDDGAYVLFVDPNAESGLTQTWRSLVGIFSRDTTSGKQSLLRGREDASSSSDEEAMLPRHGRMCQSYGSITSGTGLDGAIHSSQEGTFWLPHVTMTCLGASVAILIVGYLLAMTGRKKQAQEVDAGIIFAVVSSLLFAISGVASLFRLGKSCIWLARLAALLVLAIDAIASGALLAWILA